MLLRLKVKPYSKIDEIICEADGSLKIKIKAPPAEGKANQYLIAYLARVLGIAKSKIKILKGNTARYKTLEIDAGEKEVLKKLY